MIFAEHCVADAIQPAVAAAESEAWTAHTAENGSVYYYNSQSGKSAWTKPGEEEDSKLAEAEERLEDVETSLAEVKAARDDFEDRIVGETQQHVERLRERMSERERGWAKVPPAPPAHPPRERQRRNRCRSDVADDPETVRRLFANRPID